VLDEYSTAVKFSNTCFSPDKILNVVCYWSLHASATWEHSRDKYYGFTGLINSQWRESWKSTLVVNAHLGTTPQSDNRALLSLDNSGLSWTVFAPDKVTAVTVRRNGNFQTLISVPAVRPKRCHTLSNPAHRQDYTMACLNYTLQTMMPLPGWPVMAPNAYDNNTTGLMQRIFNCDEIWNIKSYSR